MVFPAQHVPAWIFLLIIKQWQWSASKAVFFKKGNESNAMNQRFTSDIPPWSLSTPYTETRWNRFDIYLAECLCIHTYNWKTQWLHRCVRNNPPMRELFSCQLSPKHCFAYLSLIVFSLVFHKSKAEVFSIPAWNSQLSSCKGTRRLLASGSFPWVISVLL